MSDETAKLHVMELKNITEIDFGEVSAESLIVLRSALEVEWELRPDDANNCFRLIARANLGFKRGGQVIMYD